MCVNPLYENLTINNKIKILFIDEDEHSHLVIKTILSKLFQTYETAYSSKEALEKFQTIDIDVIITEINMKNSDGLKLIQTIRKHNSLIPIIVVSSDHEKNDYIELINLDISGFISKPIHHGELLENLSKVVKKIDFKNTIENHKTQLININNDLEQQMIQRISEIYALNEEIKATQREVIFTMGTICESRSKETGNHVKRVALYSEIFARYYGLNEEEILLMKEASPMHDIGKIAIPDAILNKKGSLTKEEKIIMNTHTTLGHDMLKYSNRKLLKIAASVAYEHHEKYDGTGYPQGLKAEEISIYGRITALADVFDALGSNRCYKKAWEDEAIFTLIKEQKAKHFDPKLVDIFFEHLDEFFAVREKYQDVLAITI